MFVSGGIDATRFNKTDGGIDAAASLCCVFPLGSSDIIKYLRQVLRCRIPFTI